MNTTTQRVIANVMVEKDMDWAISRQAVRATGGSFNDQNVPTLAVDEVPRVPDTLRGEDMIWTAVKVAEVGVKSPGGNKSIRAVTPLSWAVMRPGSIQSVGSLTW